MTGNSIVNIGKDKNLWDVITGNNPNENWWLTGWNPAVQGLTNNELTLTGILDFSKDNRTKAIYDSLIVSKDTQFNKHKSEIEDLGNYKVRIKW